ncbi:hypothetical protein MNBD_UNCLBAC01-461 [hydrothermal vent metagenome]|uniref:Beta-lactamase-related domain-containing protein n=1 Tax=hydrothermal vent metagenome TaxID=652676 RepID=A0A3B1CW91_9ZZZZ
MPFYLASLAKQFTVMGVMMLVEEDRISYEDKISRFFPTLPSVYKNITPLKLCSKAKQDRYVKSVEIKYFYPDVGNFFQLF